MGKKAPGSYPLDKIAILLFFDPNRRYLPVLVHQASVRPLLAAAFLFFVIVLSKDHPWFEQLNHRHIYSGIFGGLLGFFSKLVSPIEL